MFFLSSLVASIGLPKVILIFILLNLFSAGKTFSVPNMATGTIGISCRAAKNEAPFLPSFSLVLNAVPSGKIHIISFFLLILKLYPS